jgi:hypothetical protein
LRSEISGETRFFPDQHCWPRHWDQRLPVIYLIVHHEFSYDKFEKDGGRIYRVVTNMHFPEQDFKNAGAPGPLSMPSE